jgi:putative membrane protein
LLSIASLPGVNAALNATSALLLAAGYFYIRGGRIAAHRRCMLAALTTSALFLTSYLIYHYHVGSVPFAGRGWIRAVYFAVLVSHTILAVVIVPLVLITLTRALKADFLRHRAIARWTLPLWFYVSVTGVVVYWMLYRLELRP